MTVRRKLAAYLALTKPRVIELLLVVTAPTMILAQNGLPEPLAARRDPHRRRHERRLGRARSTATSTATSTAS